jgi:hypothetical protein
LNSLPKAFAIEALVLLVISLLPQRKLLPANVDVQIHFTYFVVNPYVVCFAMASFLCLYAAGYSLLALNLRAAAWHFRITTFAIPLFWTSFYLWSRLMGEQPANQLQLLSALTFVLASFVVLLSPIIFPGMIGAALLTHSR